jgi:glycosyltransferase involved in cell wall biosynthesis
VVDVAPASPSAVADQRYAILVSGRARRREDVAAGREPRRDWLELADALGARLVEGGHGWRGRAAMSGLAAAWTAFRRRDEYDVIVSDTERSGLLLALLFKLSRTRRGHVVVAHWLSPTKKRLILEWLGVASAIDRVVVYGSSQERFALERLHLPPAKVALVLHAADAEFWRPLGNARSGICSAGLEQRDYRTLMEAVSGLDVRVTIAAASAWSGHDPLPDEGLPGNVIKRRLDYLGLRELYDRSEFVVVPLMDVDFQAGSLVMYEAMAMGKAVIATRTRAHRYGDIVRDGETGLLVPPGDAAALREAILRLHRDPEEARRMGENARRIVERGLNHREYLQGMLRIVREVAASRGSRRS